MIGILLVDSFPFEITIESGDVGGPSAGLMWAVGLYDLLTPGDLTRGRTIAGTGRDRPRREGRPDRRDRSTRSWPRAMRTRSVMLVPRDNFDELRDVDTGDLTLIPVSTFDEAVKALSAS